MHRASSAPSGSARLELLRSENQRSQSVACRVIAMPPPTPSVQTRPFPTLETDDLARLRLLRAPQAPVHQLGHVTSTPRPPAPPTRPPSPPTQPNPEPEALAEDPQASTCPQAQHLPAQSPSLPYANPATVPHIRAQPTHPVIAALGRLTKAHTQYIEQRAESGMKGPFTLPQPWSRGLKQQIQHVFHILHHYQLEARDFGVSDAIALAHTHCQ